MGKRIGIGIIGLFIGLTMYAIGTEIGWPIFLVALLLTGLFFVGLKLIKFF